MRYKNPITIVLEVAAGLLSMSAPDAGDIGSPSVRYNSKSVWDEVDEQYNIIKEKCYEDKVYE